ncbi:MAG TPA: hypothetical protein VK048_03960 [Atopostipes sp.]|nr:hypothetical protein [Atopostipes sp.]
MSENNLKEINVKKNNISTLDQLDLSGGFTCDMETGICGPAEEIQKKKESNRGEKE